MPVGLRLEREPASSPARHPDRAQRCLCPVNRLTIVAHPDHLLKLIAASVPDSSCRSPLRSAAPRPAETRAILTQRRAPDLHFTLNQHTPCLQRVPAALPDTPQYDFTKRDFLKWGRGDILVDYSRANIGGAERLACGVLFRQSWNSGPRPAAGSTHQHPWRSRHVSSPQHRRTFTTSSKSAESTRRTPCPQPSSPAQHLAPRNCDSGSPHKSAPTAPPKSNR